jgi:ribosomal protein S18 acetylase RimI-like enzyme
MNTVSISTSLGALELKRAGDGDFDSVYAVMIDASAWLKSRGINMWGWVPRETGRKIVRDRMQNHDVYLARHDSRPIATFSMQWTDEEMWDERGRDGHAGYIHGIAVARIAAGRGVGAALIDHAETMVAARGRKLLRLDCMAENKSLCAYYERLDFSHAGLKQGTGWSAALFQRPAGAK